MNQTIPPNVNIEATVPTVTRNKNNSENKVVNENENEKESESESEKENENESEKPNENEITVDIHVPNPLPTNVEEEITPTQSVETATTAAQKTRKVGRPRKNQRPPKPDIQPSTHKFKLRPTTRLPSKF